MRTALLLLLLSGCATTGRGVALRERARQANSGNGVVLISEPAPPPPPKDIEIRWAEPAPITEAETMRWFTPDEAWMQKE